MSDGAPSSFDFERLRQQHRDLQRQNLSAPLSSEQRQAFIAELARAGRDVEQVRDRETLRKMLYFWAADAVAHGDLPRDAALPSLSPYSGERTTDNATENTWGGSTLDTRFAAEDIEAAADTRAIIRIAGLARQWEVANRSPGYLLTGDALDEAKKYKDKDYEIRTFVEASEAARAKSRTRLLYGTSLGLLIIVAALASGITYLFYLHQKLASAYGELEKVNKQLETTNLQLTFTRDALILESTNERQGTRDETRRAIEALNAGQSATLDPLKRLLRRLGDAQDDELARLKIAQDGELVRYRVGPSLGGATAVQNTVDAPSDIEQKPIAPTQSNACGGVLWLGSEADKMIDSDGPLSALKAGDVVKVRKGSSVRLREGMPSENYVMARQIGLVPGGASVILKDSPEVHQANPSTTKQYFASVDVPQEYCTRVFVQYVGEGSVADKVRTRLLGLSFQVPLPQKINSASKVAEVRVFREQDLPMADLVAMELSSFNNDKPLAVRRLFDFPTKPAKGTIEVWIDLDR